MAVALLGGIPLIAGQRVVPGDGAAEGGQGPGLLRRNGVPYIQVCIAGAFLRILGIAQDIPGNAVKQLSVFPDQLRHSLLRALKEQSDDLLVLHDCHLLSVSPIQSGSEGGYLIQKH